MLAAQICPIQPGNEHAKNHCQEDGPKDHDVEIWSLMLQESLVLGLQGMYHGSFQQWR